MLLYETSITKMNAGGFDGRFSYETKKRNYVYTPVQQLNYILQITRQYSFVATNSYVPKTSSGRSYLSTRCPA